MGLPAIRTQQRLRDVEPAPADEDRSPLSVSVRESGAWTVVTIAGEMDLRVTPLFHGLVRDGCRRLVLDLSRVTFMDVSGLDLLVERHREALRADGCLRLVAPSRHVSRVLLMTATNRTFTTCGSVHEAISRPVLCPSVTGPALPRDRPIAPL